MCVQNRFLQMGQGTNQGFRMNQDLLAIAAPNFSKSRIPFPPSAGSQAKKRCQTFRNIRLAPKTQTFRNDKPFPPRKSFPSREKKALPAFDSFHFAKFDCGSPHNCEAVTTGLNLTARVDDIDTDWAAQNMAVVCNSRPENHG